jgi:hypothetical protein
MRFQNCFFALTIAVFQLIPTISSADESKLDLSHLKFPSEILKLIKENIPADLDSILFVDIDPEVYNLNFSVLQYRRSDQDSTERSLLIYMTDGATTASLQLFRKTDSIWRFLSQNRAVRECQPMAFELMDVNCDGRNEILIRGAVGMGGFEYVDILSIVGDSLEIVSDKICGIELEGRTIDFKKVGSPCGWELVVTQDGPKKFEVGQKRTYRLDPVTKTFKLVSDVKVSDKK